MKKQLLNVAGLTAGDIGARIAGFLITVYLARILEPAGFGLISIGLALVGQLALLASPGVQIIEARNVAAGGTASRGRVGVVLGMRLALATGLWLAAAAVLFAFPAFGDTRVVLTLFTASLFPMAMMTDWYFQGMEKGLLTGGARLLQAVVYGIVLVILVHSASDTPYVPVALFAGNAAAAIVLLALFTSREGIPSLRWDPSGWREVFRQNAPVGFAVAMGQMVINYPPVAVGWLVGTVEAGLWGAALKLVFLVLMADRVLNVALVPPMTRILTRNDPGKEQLVTLLFRIVAGGILPVVFLGIVFASPAVSLVFGHAYAGASWMLAALMGYVLLTLVNSVFVCAMIGGRKERQYSRMMVLGSLFMVLAVTVLTAVAGTAGTVAGVLAGEALTAGLMIAGVRRTLALRVPLFHKDLAAGAIVLAAAYLVFREPAFQALAGVGVYGLVLLVFRSFTAADLKELQRRLA